MLESGFLSYKEVIQFWFEEINPQQQWAKDDQFDALIRKNFGALHKLASGNKLKSWRNHHESALAEIIILDQFSRNIYRGSSKAFENDTLSLQLSQEAIDKKFDDLLEKRKILFLYMPFMHSEEKEIHTKAIELFKKRNLNLEYELKHKSIIDRFGRYPHRNKIIGRKSTKEEIEFLATPNSSF